MNTEKVSKLSNMVKLLAIAGVAAGLSACGGGGGSSSSLTVQGTAATGKALDGAAISVTCASGTGTAVANAAGGYTVNVDNGAGPCVLTATKGATVLHSITPGAGVANITPLTELLTQYLAGSAGTTVGQLLADSKGKALLGDTQAITNAQTALVTFLKTQYNITVVATNFLTVPIVPVGTGTQSDSDKDLDLLRASNKVDANGNVDSQTGTDCEHQGELTPYVPTTGATGATGGYN